MHVPTNLQLPIQSSIRASVSSSSSPTHWSTRLIMQWKGRSKATWERKCRTSSRRQGSFWTERGDDVFFFIGNLSIWKVRIGRTNLAHLFTIFPEVNLNFLNWIPRWVLCGEGEILIIFRCIQSCSKPLAQSLKMKLDALLHYKSSCPAAVTLIWRIASKVQLEAVPSG